MKYKTPVYLKGLGDLYVKAEQLDDIAFEIDDSEDIREWTGIGGTTVALSQQQVNEGKYSILVSNVNDNGDGAEWNPDAGTVDLSDYENGLFAVWIYPDCSGIFTVQFQEGVDSESWNYACTASQWNKVLLDMADPDTVVGVVDWSLIDGIAITVAGSACDFNIDRMVTFEELSDVEREQNIRIACLSEIGVETSDDTVELRCSRNEIEETDIIATEITLSATVQDFDPNGMALVGAGEVTTDSVTKQIEGEAFTVPNVAPYTYELDEHASLKIGNGYGAWVVKAETGEMMQETPDSTIIPQGWYYIDATTGVLTFNAADSGVAMLAYYNVVTSGRTYVATSDREFLEFAVQFQIKGSNNKDALLFFPRVKSNSFAITPNKEEYWNYNFEGKVLIDTATGEYYEFHVIEE